MSVPGRERGHDGDLVRAVQGGDLDAFSELFRRYYPSVHGACTRRLGDVVEADEVAQATFVRALERIHQCRGERRFGPWVHVIARYLCVDHCRARARVVPHETPLSDDHSDGARPEDALLEVEQRDQVQRAIADLPERQRRAVTFRALGLRPGEIAATLGLSISAVDSLLLRARRRLALTYTSMASEGGTAAAATGTSATASVGGALVVDHAEITEGIGATASQVVATVSSLPGVRPAGGFVSAVVGAALSLGGSGQATAPPAATPPAPANAAVAPGPGAAAGPGGPVVVVDHHAPGPGAVTVVLPAGPTRVPVLSAGRVGTGRVAAPAPTAAHAPPAAAPELVENTVGLVTGSLPDVPVVSDVVTTSAEPAPALRLPPVTVPPVDLPLLDGDGAPLAKSAGDPAKGGASA